jgi:hypothetical protein
MKHKLSDNFEDDNSVLYGEEYRYRLKIINFT